MGTHGSFGILLERIKDIVYVSVTSNGTPENMGEYLLSVLRTGGVAGYLEAMVSSDLERVDHLERSIFTVASEEELPEWTFSEWVYLYKPRTECFLVCYPDTVGKEKGNLGITGQNPYAKELYALSVLLEIPINETETIMEMYFRKRDLKKKGLYLTL